MKLAEIRSALAAAGVTPLLVELNADKLRKRKEPAAAVAQFIADFRDTLRDVESNKANEFTDNKQLSHVLGKLTHTDPLTCVTHEINVQAVKVRGVPSAKTDYKARKVVTASLYDEFGREARDGSKALCRLKAKMTGMDTRTERRRARMAYRLEKAIARNAPASTICSLRAQVAAC